MNGTYITMNGSVLDILYTLVTTSTANRAERSTWGSRQPPPTHAFLTRETTY